MRGWNVVCACGRRTVVGFLEPWRCRKRAHELDVVVTATRIAGRR